MHEIPRKRLMIMAIAGLGTWYLLDQPSPVWFQVLAVTVYLFVMLVVFIKCPGTDDSGEAT